MKAYIIVGLKDRVIFPEHVNDYLYVTPTEYKHLTDDDSLSHMSKDSKTGIHISYKGFDNSQVCVDDLVAEGKIKVIDFSKVSISQIEKLLKL
jgi:hypothetical protein